MSNIASFSVFAVSDATGGLAQSLAVAAVRQFPGVNTKIVRRSKIQTQEQIEAVVKEVKDKKGVIVFTMVSQIVRRMLLDETKKQDVVVMDVMGPVLDMFSHYFHTLPSDEPGLQYKVTQDYFKRTEAVEFTVRHDDGLEMDSINDADIVLLGVSRTSKTPLSIYLAFQGFRCANIPIVPGIPISNKIRQVDRKKMIGLVVSPDKLATVRSSRLKKMGRPETEDYAQKEHIEDELRHARELFRELGHIPVIDVSGKAIEEVASELLHILHLA